MGFLDDLVGLLQKPQSAAMGTYAGLMKMIDPRQDVEDRLGGDDPLSGFMAGLKGNIRPHEVQDYLKNDYRYGNDGLGDKLLNSAADVVLDPLMLLGPIAKSGALGTKAATAADAALGAGNYADDLSKTAKIGTAAARAARRTYQGTLATGDLLSGIGAGQLMGLGENALSKVLPKVIGGVLKNAPELSDELADSVGSAVTLGDSAGPPRGALGMGRQAETAQRVASEVPSSGEIITPEVIQRAMLGQGASPSGASEMFEPAALGSGSRLPSRQFQEAMPIPGTGGPMQMGIGQGSEDPLSAMFSSRSQGRLPVGPLIPEIGPISGSPEELFAELLKRVSTGSSQDDQITRALRMILQGQ